MKMIIQNGTVIDPLNRLCEITDLTVENGKITAVGPSQPAPDDNVIDAAGCFVTPGLIDHHCHIYPMAAIGLPGEAVCFASGVTTAVEAGSTGPATYAMYRPFMQLSKLSIYPYLNVAGTGLATLPSPLEDVAHINEKQLAACFEQYGSELLGLKLRTSAPIVKELGYEPLRQTVKIADKLGVSVMVHCTDPPGEMDELVDILRPGDIMTHTYMNIGSTIIGEDGHVKKSVREAREKGVIFEVADARAHFGLPVAQAAIADGFLPDIIATDITHLSMHLRPTSFNLAMQISKYTALGIPYEKCIELATVAPARHMGILDKAGSLTPGHPADIAVFRPVEMENVFGDRPNGSAAQHTITGSRVYQPVLTVKNGEMVYRDITF